MTDAEWLAANSTGSSTYQAGAPVWIPPGESVCWFLQAPDADDPPPPEPDGWAFVEQWAGPAMWVRIAELRTWRQTTLEAMRAELERAAVSAAVAALPEAPAEEPT